MLYQMSKYFFKYLQNSKQTNSMVFMKSWDTITAEFDEDSPFFNSANFILKDKLCNDYEFRFYIIRVNSLYRHDKMIKIGLSKLDFLAVLRKTLVRKNEQLSSKDHIILTDPATGRTPSDYATVLNQHANSISEDENRYRGTRHGMKTLEYSGSSESSRPRHEKPTQHHRQPKRSRRSSHSSSPEYHNRHRKSPEPVRYVQRRNTHSYHSYGTSKPAAAPVHTSHHGTSKPITGAGGPPTSTGTPAVGPTNSKGKSESDFSDDKNADRKGQKDSLSSREISIHYRDNFRYRPPA